MQHLKLVENRLDEENLGEVSSTLNFDAMLEDSADLIADLQNAYSRVKAIGDEITKMSEQTNDVELKSVFIGLAGDAYTLALDIEEAGQTVQDLKSEDLTVPDEEMSGLENLEEVPEIPEQGEAALNNEEEPLEVEEEPAEREEL